MIIVQRQSNYDLKKLLLTFGQLIALRRWHKVALESLDFSMVDRDPKFESSFCKLSYRRFASSISSFKKKAFSISKSYKNCDK